MKKIFFLITAIMCIFANVVFASEINEEYNEEMMNEVKQTLIYRVSNNGLFSKWGWSQKDVVTQHLSQNNGYKKLLNVDSVLDAATIDNVEYGHIIGVCEINFRKLDKYIVDPQNADFKIATVRFDVLCPMDRWVVNGKSLRPYLIMNEIDKDFNEKKLAGIGNLSFISSNRLVVSPYLSGYSLKYGHTEFN